MKINVERGAFLKALNHVQSVVERRNTIPILSNVLIEAAKGQLKLTATDLDIEIVEALPADVLRIRGEHNALNALAALALACSTGSQLAPMLYGLREYRGEPHRVDSVAIVNDVEYIDDSKRTNVGATVAALQGLGRQRRLVVILGGDGKGQDFSPLLEPVRRHVRAVLLLGRMVEALLQATPDVL